jgi:acetyltransferase-like isoleucine patch superfamily enzyme
VLSRTDLRRLSRRAVGELVHRGWRQVQNFGAIHPGSARSELFGNLGEGSIIVFPSATIVGHSEIHIGRETLIAPWVTLSAGYPGYEDEIPPRALVIGDRCVIGIRSGIAAHESIEIGNDVWFGQDVFVTDANHGMDDPDVPIGRQYGEHLPVRIGDGSWLGHGSVVLPGVTIGRNAVIAAGAVVRTDVPDHSVAAGVPARIVRSLRPDDPSEPGRPAQETRSKR